MTRTTIWFKTVRKTIPYKKEEEKMDLVVKGFSPRKIKRELDKFI